MGQPLAKWLAFNKLQVHRVGHKVWVRQTHETTRQLKLGNVTVESGGCLELLGGSEVWGGTDGKLQKCKHEAMAGRGGCAMCVDWLQAGKIR